MKVVLLCGGFGTRIRDVSDNLPKPMIQIGGLPILWHIMKYYAAWGHKDFILCLGYNGTVIRDFFLNYKAHTTDCTIDLSGKRPITYHNSTNEDWNVTLAETGLNAMTGARVKRVEKYLDGEDFMLTYGDGLGTINIDELVAFHKRHGKILTITGVRPPGRFGELRSDRSGKVTQFDEKPQASGGRISGGFFVCRHDIFDYLNDREDLTFEQEPMRRLVKEGEMMVYNHDDFWQPMDTFREFTILNRLYDQHKAPWVIW